MKHAVIQYGGRLHVGFQVHGTPVMSVVCDFPLAAAAAARREAARLTCETAPAAPTPAPEDRRVPRGFYAEEFGDA